MINRRGLITGLISFVAAPAIVKASSIMPVKSFIEPVEFYQDRLILYPYQRFMLSFIMNSSYGKFGEIKLRDSNKLNEFYNEYARLTREHSALSNS